MYKYLADKIRLHLNNLAEVESKTGVTQQTMRNIIRDPDAKRSRVTILALENYFKGKRK